MLFATWVAGFVYIAASSQHPSPSAKHKSEQSARPDQENNATPPAAKYDRSGGESHEQQKEKGEFWSAKLTDWLLAVLTFFLALFTYQLWKSTEKLWASTKATVELAREEFTATHRPRIVIYEMQTHSGDGSTADGRVHFRYVNVGDTDAFVTSISSVILWTDKGLVRAGVEPRSHNVIRRPIHVPSGNNGYAISIDDVDTIKLIQSGRNGHDTAYCVGVVVYRDTNDIERRTGFCRRYDSERERWLKVEDPDYEYEY